MLDFGFRIVGSVWLWLWLELRVLFLVEKICRILVVLSSVLFVFLLLF